MYDTFAGEDADILELAIKHRDRLSTILEVSAEESSESELAAMVSFAIAFPGGFMALVDTYDVKRYFCHVAFFYLFNTLVNVQNTNEQTHMYLSHIHTLPDWNGKYWYLLQWERE